MSRMRAPRSAKVPRFPVASRAPRSVLVLVLLGTLSITVACDQGADERAPSTGGGSGRESTGGTGIGGAGGGGEGGTAGAGALGGTGAVAGSGGAAAGGSDQGG